MGKTGAVTRLCFFLLCFFFFSVVAVLVAAMPPTLTLSVGKKQVLARIFNVEILGRQELQESFTLAVGVTNVWHVSPNGELLDDLNYLNFFRLNPDLHTCRHLAPDTYQTVPFTVYNNMTNDMTKLSVRQDEVIPNAPSKGQNKAFATVAKGGTKSFDLFAPNVYIIHLRETTVHNEPGTVQRLTTKGYEVRLNLRHCRSGLSFPGPVVHHLDLTYEDTSGKIKIQYEENDEKRTQTRTERMTIHKTIKRNTLATTI